MPSLVLAYYRLIKPLVKFQQSLCWETLFQKNQAGYIYDNSNSLIIPGLYNVNYRQGEASINQQYSSTGLISVFGDLTLGYNNFLFLHASGRNDWTSKLDPSNRSFFYPDVDASFVFTDALSILKDSKLLSYGKIRAAWTKVGNISVGPYSLNNVALVGGGFPYGSTAGFTISNNFANPNLEPEFTHSKEAGFELGSSETGSILRLLITIH